MKRIFVDLERSSRNVAVRGDTTDDGPAPMLRDRTATGLYP